MARNVAVNQQGLFLVDCPAHPPRFGTLPGARIDTVDSFRAAKRDFADQTAVDAFLTARVPTEVGKWFVMQLPVGVN
jgi:hypothetical protein